MSHPESAAEKVRHPLRTVVTGATSGIGEAIARRLASEGHTLVLVGRDDERLKQAAQRIGSAVPDARLEVQRADLSLLAETAQLAEHLAAEPPDVVVSNAAVATDPAATTAEGLPVMLAVNHLAPYVLLRSLARPVAERRHQAGPDEAPARFVIVGADPAALSRAAVDLDDLHLVRERTWGFVPSLRPFLGYGRTKNMNAMFCYALAERLQGEPVTVNAAHPGVISGTRLDRDNRGLLRLATRIADRVMTLPGPDEGADTPCWLATAPELAETTGRFFVRRSAVPTAAHTTDPARCDRLWRESARLSGMAEEL